MKRPHVRIETRNFGGGMVTGPALHVFIDGEEWPVKSVGTHHRPDELAEITLTFVGKLEVVEVGQ